MGFSILVLVNLDIVNCLDNLIFFLPTEVHEATLLNNFFNILNLTNLNALFINYIFIIIFLYVFFIKTFFQKKLLTIILVYLFIFSIFTPLTQYELRIILLPFLLTYIFEYIHKKNYFNNSFK